MSLDHDIPTHLDVADRPALGLTTAQLLLLVSGVLAGVGALRQPHVALGLRLGEGLLPPGAALLLVAVRPAGRSLVAWGHVAVQHLTSPRLFGWASAQGGPSTASQRSPARPPHLALLGATPASAATTSPPSRRPVRYPATQGQAFIPWAIADDVVTFRDGRRCAVLECTGPNTALMGEEVLRATHAAYHAFLVGLPWPLQLLVWASPVDLRAHVAARDARLAALPLALREVESADVAFMEREARRLGLLDQRLFVVIPAPDRGGRTVPTAPLLAALRARLHPAFPASSDNGVAAILDERCERVISGLAGTGVHAWRLSTDGLRTLWYRLLAPRRAALQPVDPGHAAPTIRPHIVFPRRGKEEHDA